MKQIKNNIEAKTNRKVLLFLVSFMLVAVLISCTRNQDMLQEKEKNDVKVHLSFAFKGAAYTTDANTKTRGATRGEVTTDEQDGTDAEQRINNMWVLLFSNGVEDGGSLLKYCFSFTPGSTMTDNYEESEGVFINNNALYITSTKLVNPGTYRAVIVVNTKQYVSRYPYVGGAEYNSVKDVMRLFNLTPGTTSYADFKEYTKNTLFDIANMARCDKALETQDPALGIFAYYVDDALEVKPGYTSPNMPLQKEIDLKRWLSKVRVRISNTSDGVNIIPESKGYILKDIRLENYFPIGKLFEWDTHAYQPITTKYNTDNLIDLGFGAPALYPVLGELNTTDTGDRLIKNETLFTHFITGYNNAMPPQAAETDALVVSLTFVHVKTGEPFVYKVPIYGPDAGICPPYIENGKFSKYTILRNTLYELNLIFKGKSMESETGLKVLPWKEKKVNDNNQIDFIIT